MPAVHLREGRPISATLTSRPVATGRPRLRPEIQALRAIAVASVLIYHLWPDWLPGGFAGVDIFFVISGFLIGGHLLSELERTGRVRLGRFWVRRAKRLLPASLIVLFAVVVAVLLVAPLSTRAASLHEVVGAVLYVENWVLASKSVNYLALGDAASPVRHYWSLGVEEQLYGALPLVLAGVALARRTASRRTSRPASPDAAGRLAVGRPVAVVLLLLAAASLTWSVVSTNSDAPVAYFSTLTRAWEFLLGTLLACVRVSIRRRARVALGMWGTLAMVLAMVVLGDQSPYPGYRALLPVVGTVLVLAAADAGPVAALSRVRPVTWLGDVSYALYLWHWPLIVLVPYATGELLTSLDKVGIIVISVALAAASTYLVENPIRSSRRLAGGSGRWRVVVVAIGVASVVIAGGALLGAQASQDRQIRQLADTRERIATTGVDCLGAAALDPAATGCPDLGNLLLPPPSSASLDDYNRPECWATIGVSDLHVCGVGSDDPDARRVFAVGDSHNNVYLAAYEEIADQTGWHVDVAGRAGCSWGTRPQEGPSKAIGEECTIWKSNVADYLAASEPYDLILTVSDQAGYLAVPGPGEKARKATIAGLSEAWASQVRRGTPVIAIRDWPRGRADVVQCVEQHESDAVRRCSRDRDDAIPGFDAARKAVLGTPGTAMVDLRDLMCVRQRCLPVIGNVVVYRNSDHLTTTFVRTLVPYLLARIAEAKTRAGTIRSSS